MKVKEGLLEESVATGESGETEKNETSVKCDCVKIQNEGLKEFNLELEVAFTAGGVVPIISSNKIDRSVKGVKRQVFPAYCPFCGRRY